MNQAYNCNDNNRQCGCGCGCDGGHWECTMPPEVTPLSPELVKAFYETNPNTEVFTTLEKMKLKMCDCKGGGGGTGVVKSIVAGTNITVDATDPANPIVSATDSQTVGKPRVDAADVLPPLADVKPGDVRFIRPPHVTSVYDLDVKVESGSTFDLYTKGVIPNQKFDNVDTYIRYVLPNDDIEIRVIPFDISHGVTILGVHVPASEIIYDVAQKPPGHLRGTATSTLIDKIKLLTDGSTADFSMPHNSPFREYVATEHKWNDVTPTSFAGKDFSVDSSEDEIYDVFTKPVLIPSSEILTYTGSHITTIPEPVSYAQPNADPLHADDASSATVVSIQLVVDNKVIWVDSEGTLRLDGEKFSEIAGIPLDLAYFKELSWSRNNHKVYAYEDKVIGLAIYNKIKNMDPVTAKGAGKPFIEQYVYDGVGWEEYDKGLISIVPGSGNALRSLTADFMHNYELKDIGDNSFAVGGSTKASGDNSVAFCGSTASGNTGFSVGADATASGGNSIALGETAIASTNSAIAIGYNVKAEVDKSIILGQYNAVNTDYKLALAIGIGPYSSHRKNGLELYTDKAVKLPGFNVAEVAKDPKNAATVEYVKSVIPKGIPDMPTADGDYKLHVASGVATWVKLP